MAKSLVSCFFFDSRCIFDMNMNSYFLQNLPCMQNITVNVYNEVDYTSDSDSDIVLFVA